MRPHFHRDCICRREYNDASWRENRKQGEEVPIIGEIADNFGLERIIWMGSDDSCGIHGSIAARYINDAWNWSWIKKIRVKSWFFFRCHVRRMRLKTTRTKYYHHFTKLGYLAWENVAPNHNVSHSKNISPGFFVYSNSGRLERGTAAGSLTRGRSFPSSLHTLL